MVKDFKEYIKEGIVREIEPDNSRAESLRISSENSLNHLKKITEIIGIDDENSNDLVKISYDIIMEKIRARMLEQGLYSSGRGAHEAEVSYLKTLNLKDRDISFMDQMRYFRNGIIYYGTIVDKEYAEKVIRFTKKMNEVL